jgi:multidrug efflux system membrane fusion protein
MSTRFIAVTLCFVVSLAASSPGHADQPAPVPVSQPVQRQVTDYQDFTGRTEASSSVTIRARVTGYLIRVAFKDGADVRQGDVLFEIDPRPYQAALDQAQSEVTLHEAGLRLAKAVYERDTALSAKAPGAIGQQQLDQDKAAVEEATAKLRNAQAGAESVKLNLDFTRVRSPINGRIGRRLLDPGNLVKADDTALAMVIAPDPIHAYFEMDEATLLHIRRAVNDGKFKLGGAVPVFLGLSDEAGHPHQGTVDFVNGQVNAASGTVTVRGLFANPKPVQGDRLLMPGMFARIRLPIGQPYQALLVPESALGSEQGLKFVYVIDAENKAQYRRVTVGAVQPDGLRVVSEGLKPDDRVAVGALQRLRPGIIVKPEKANVPNQAPGKEPAPDPDEKKP